MPAAPTINGTPAASIAAAIRVFVEQDDVTEIRILNTGRTGTVSGFFDNADKAAAEASKWNKRAPGVYFMPNKVNPALLARGNNRLVEYAKQTTSDTDIIKLCWLLLDFDPVRPAGISSTEAEHAAALDRAASCRDWLTSHGWTAPVFADSGNGAHLCYLIDLPNTDASKELVKSIIAAAAFQFTDSVVVVDLTTYNPARIWKLYGTHAAKGDATDDRPHRLSRILEIPEPLTKVPRDLLELVAGMAPKAETAQTRQSSSNNQAAGKFDLDQWIADHGLPVVSHGPWSKGYKYILNPCPWNADHTNRAAFILRFENGAIDAGCRHNGCAGKGWHDLRDIFEVGWRDRQHNKDNHAETNKPEPPPAANKPQAPANERATALTATSVAAMLTQHKALRLPVIHGLLREGESANVISTSKVGKSWLALMLAMSVATGRKFLDTFETVPGRVLIIDNELHRETLTHRIRRVADEMNIPHGAIGDVIEVLSLRGQLLDLFALEEFFCRVERGFYKLILVDAMYRALPKEVDENSNAGMASVYNRIDAYADRIGCAFVMVHHTSKGSQANKSVTDVGAGAGAQSRAVDTHLVLRQHDKDDGAVVLEGAVRSWAPIAPVCLRWEFPLWRPALDLDPSELKGRQAATAEDKARETADKKEATRRANAAKIVHVLEVRDPHRDGMGYTAVRHATGLNNEYFGDAVTYLIEADKAEEFDGTVEIGSGAKRKSKMIRLKGDGGSLLDHRDHRDNDHRDNVS